MLKIRKAKKDDLNELARIYKRAYERPDSGENWEVKDAKKLLEFYFNQKTFVGLTALVDKEIVGAFFSFIKPWHNGNHLGEGELFVDPKYQNKKIGTELFLEMMTLARKKKCTSHELVAYEKISNWYNKFGIKATGLKHMSGEISDIIKKLKQFIAI